MWTVTGPFVELRPLIVNLTSRVWSKQKGDFVSAADSFRLDSGSLASLFLLFPQLPSGNKWFIFAKTKLHDCGNMKRQANVAFVGLEKTQKKGNYSQQSISFRRKL